MMPYKDRELGKIFEAAYHSIAAPETMKKETLKQMMDEDKHLKRENHKPVKRKILIRYYGAAAAALCAVILGILMLRPTGILYVTPMEEGVFYDEVELENGVIRFRPNQVVISIAPNAGHGMIGQEEPAKEIFDEKEPELIEQTETESGGEMKLLRKDTVLLPETDEDSWSHIGEQKVYVSVLKTEGIQYRAVYDKDGAAYEVTGTNVTQKEFIDYLYQKVKN